MARPHVHAPLSCQLLCSPSQGPALLPFSARHWAVFSKPPRPTARAGGAAGHARGARGSPRAGRGRISPSVTAAGSPAPEGAGRQVTAETELYLPWAVRFSPRPGRRLQPRARFHRRPAAVPDPGWQPGLVRPPPAPGRVLGIPGAGRRRPAASGRGHRVHGGLGGVVPAGGLQALAGLRHLPAAGASPHAQQGAHARHAVPLRAQAPAPRVRPAEPESRLPGRSGGR